MTCINRHLLLKRPAFKKIGNVEKFLNNPESNINYLNMIFEIIWAIILGVIFGTFTGLSPGIHINLVSVILISILDKFHSIPLIALASFIVSMSITHTFVDFIPSVFLGAPEEDTFLSVLPGHEMLKQGKAHEAVVLSLYGSLMALGIIIIFIPIFILGIPLIENFIKTFIAFILIFVSCYLVLRDKNWIYAATIFSLSGFLGYATLNLPVKEPLLALLTGLFGSSALIVSIKNKTKIKKQKVTKIKKIKLSKEEILKSFFAAIISAPLSSFLPGMGSGQAAIIGSELIKQSKRGFVTLIGAINTIVMGLSFVTLFVLGKTRTGSALAVKRILSEITISDLTTIIMVVIISGLISFIISINLSKIFAKKIHRIKYPKLSLIVLFFLTMIILMFSNFLGFIVFIISTFLGIFTILSGARRINLMGVLLIPTIIFYLLL